jgi:hypothetical protein
MNGSQGVGDLPLEVAQFRGFIFNFFPPVVLEIFARGRYYRVAAY